jgi:4-amino-4-deoxy-L-arabinose transferase-like glycosyltransferase
MDTGAQFLKTAGSWAARHPLLVIGMALGLGLGPFLGKPIHMDDPLFVWTAEWIRRHPLDFYGFEVNWYGITGLVWYGDTGLMAAINCNPPATAYFLAGVASVFGWGEVALHGGFLLPAFAAGAGIYQLARTWCGRPLLATLTAMATPVFLVSGTTLMSDVPMLALWVWAVVLWERALINGGHLRFLAAATLAGLAVLTKYSALTFLPLFIVLGLLRRRRPGGWLLWLIVPAAMMAAYQIATAKLYGQGLITAAADYAAANRLVFEGGWPAKGIIGLAFTGGCLLPALCFAPWLWPRRSLLAGSVVTVGLSLGALSLCEKLGTMDLANPASADWSFWVQMTLLMAGGLHLLLLTTVELRQRRDTVTLMLALWILSGFIFATVLNWTINARSLLPIVPAAAILLIRRLERTNPLGLERGRWWGPLIASGAVSLGVAAADFELARSARTAARQIAAQYRPAAGRLWFQGHWGFQYYMEKLGAHPVDLALTTLQPGDIVALPANNSNITPPANDDAELLEMAAFEAGAWLSTMRPDIGAGFYDADCGPLPFIVKPAPLERYGIYKVLRPMQFHKLTARMPQTSETPDSPATPADYEAALRVNPADARAHGQLAVLLQQQGRMEEAAGHFREALRFMPDQPAILNNYAWLLATCPDDRIRNGAEAVQLAERACRLTRYRQIIIVGTLAAAYAEAGRFAEAVSTAQKACDLAAGLGAQDLLKKNQELLELYRRRQPYREVADIHRPAEGDPR